MRAFIALIERLPVTFAVICTAWLSVSWLTVPFARRVPVWATTRMLCCDVSGPSLPAV